LAAHQENAAKPPKLAQTECSPEEPPRCSLEKTRERQPS
jgi:hypothetical protein